MNPIELIKYELPRWIESCSNKYIQNVVAWYYGKKVNRKWRNYLERCSREKYLKEKNLI